MNHFLILHYCEFYRDTLTKALNPDERPKVALKTAPNPLKGAKDK
ncbi:MAG: hypothetical protein RIS84_172 [Pseudomonadota bacterium]|jgi:hypothetical protein